MPRKKSHRKPRYKFPIPIKYIILALVIVFTLAGSGFGFAATQESHDRFCSSCHTQPETTFYQRSQAGTAVDLASAHTPHNTRCIDCHSGEGVLGRMSAELLGAHNALAFYTHTAVQPSVQTRPVTDASCLKCHTRTIQLQDMNNHFHVFLARWQAQDANAAHCVSCHSAHTTDGSQELKWLNRDKTVMVCDACHRSLGAE
jgi:hypothetical protein